MEIFCLGEKIGKKTKGAIFVVFQLFQLFQLGYQHATPLYIYYIIN